MSAKPKFSREAFRAESEAYSTVTIGPDNGPPPIEGRCLGDTYSITTIWEPLEPYIPLVQIRHYGSNHHWAGRRRQS